MRNKRQEQLLTILAGRQDWMTSRQLSGLLQVSDRTIRSDIDTINKTIDPPPIESNVRQGYRLRAETRGEVFVSANSNADPEIPQTPGARCIFIIRKLLFEVRELNLTVLQSQIYVSGYSIDNDLKRIRKMLEPYSSLKLVRNKECISLKGDEASKRRFYRDLLVAEVQENFLNLNRLAYLYNGFDLIEVKDIFMAVSYTHLDVYKRQVLTFGLNSAAYISESIRGGIMSVDKGQWEAAMSLGVPKYRLMLDIIFPQAFKNTLPSLINESIALLKDSSMVSIIGVADTMRWASLIQAKTFRAFEAFIIAALIYYAMVMVLTALGSYCERKLWPAVFCC